MQGTWNHGRAHYRCRFPYEYALANRIEHPAAVYVREDAVVETLDIAAEAARRELAECDRLLARHRAALEAGADPKMVAGWTRDVRRRRIAAETGLKARPAGRPQPLRPEEIAAVLDRLGGLLDVLRGADANVNCELYRELGVSMTYQHPERVVVIEAAPRQPVDFMNVSEGGIDRYAHALRRTTRLALT